MPTKLNEEVINAAIDGFMAQRFALTNASPNFVPCSTVVPLNLPPRQNQHHESAGR